MLPFFETGGKFMDCIFCKIINGSIPCYKIYEDDKILAILDISQASKGHTLVIPKKHFDNSLECDDDILMHLYKIANQLAKKLVKKLDAKGMNILTNINEVAGQSVKHFHIHLLPRYNDEDGVNINFIDSKPSWDELEKLCDYINK